MHIGDPNESVLSSGNLGEYLALYSILNEGGKSHQKVQIIMHHVTGSKDKQDNANTLCKGVRAESCTFTWDRLQVGQYVQHIILSFLQISFSSEPIFRAPFWTSAYRLFESGRYAD